MLNIQELKLNNRDPVYLQVVKYVKRQILLRAVQSGDRMPSRREIASLLNINPNTAQKAFKAMEDEGFVHTSSTSGSVLYVDEAIYRRIEEELTRELVRSFVESAKESRMSLRNVVDLIQEYWD
ncbi:GntR family transcriptional regulator [Cohnella thailandensis]|uniref:GntR family transcriptional regulator n=1 Tax=Cohnella thailandensis TaxID=557557 RepID=A0A841T0R4_9BACL|nr:GntR family transcriptional regulator [Cohnella thailandensis]MBP1974069.1 DNA-binding transcriptional regulator YhcF (GntR family) [Cohnella thailandensis]